MIDVDTAREYYSDNDSAHGFDHVLRVLRLAERIAMAEGADVEIVRTAALLHDIGRAGEKAQGRSHAVIGAERARELLGTKGDERVERVVEAIAQHRYRGRGGPTSLEAQCLFDADKLDAIGAIGVARAYAIAGYCGQRLWADVDQCYSERAPEQGAEDLDEGQHTPVHEFLFKLVKLQDRMYTETGKRLAAERHHYMVAFFERLALEVQGRD